MIYALKINPEGHGTAGNDEVVFSPSLSVSLGSSTVDWLFEFRVKLDALPSGSGTYYFVGSDSTASEGIYIRLSAGVYTLAFSTSSTLRFQSSADMLLADGEFHTYKISRLRNQSSVIFERDGVPFGSPATYANVSTAIMDVNRFGRGSTTATTFASFELDYFICSTSAGLYAEWRADLSNGSGTKLLTTDGSRDGDLLNFSGAANSWWVFYSTFYIGEGTISVSAAATASLASTKVGNATVTAVAAAVAAVQGSKIGSVPLNLPISAGIVLSANKVGAASFSIPINAVLGIAANKVGVTPLYVEAVADISLYAGNIYIGEGTFTVSASAAITLQGGKVGASSVQFGATAAAYCNASKLSAGELALTASASASLQSSKLGHSTLQVPAVIASSLTADKTGISSIAVLASATITIAGSNQAAVPTPVTLVFVRSSSRHTHNMRTSSRYNYNLITSSGGARV